MLKTFVNAFKDRDIRKKIFYTILILLVYRIGCYIPIPGINVAQFKALMENATAVSGSFTQIMSIITGGSLSSGTIFALGIIPFINASIILQLLTLIVPWLKRLGEQGEDGNRKRTQITRYAAIILAVIQGIGIVVGWRNALDPTFGYTWITGVFIVIILIAGSSLVMWLGERITEYGVSNGISLIIFIGILSGTATSVANTIGSIGNDIKNLWYLLGFIVIVVALFMLIVFIDSSERKIPVTYAKRVKGNKMYGGQSTFIPMKINGAGVMPIIFASSFLMFPQMIASFWPASGFYTWYTKWLGTGTWIYAIVLAIFILFFAFFYAMIQFDPNDISRNIKKNGGVITGINPGKPTAEFLAKINNRITLFGAIFLAFISFVPSLGFLILGDTVAGTGLINAFSATGMLIVVSVALEFHKQLEAQISLKHYNGILG
jgi:preprotein translocase subunit SecY